MKKNMTIESMIGELILDVEHAGAAEKSSGARYVTPELVILRLRDILATAKHDSIGEYQRDAYRTVNRSLNPMELEMHALHGMASEIGELHGLYQKVYQGHEFDEEHARKEVGDLLWFIAEWCTAHDVEMASVMKMNIDKLKARYPEGFEEKKSLKRAEGDV